MRPPRATEGCTGERGICVDRVVGSLGAGRESPQIWLLPGPSSQVWGGPGLLLPHVSACLSHRWTPTCPTSTRVRGCWSGSMPTSSTR